jgi:glyoxylase-like metal-dependent hydrolase (beta-lactamase superfamily II)
LIDTGSGKQEYVPLLEQALREDCKAEAPGDVLVTHVHPDHLGGARDVLERFGSRPVRKMPWSDKDELHRVDIEPLRDGARIQTEGATLRAIHSPGHAQDHLCFYLEEERALFTGDVILGAGTAVIPLDGGDMKTYLETLERLLDLDVAVIYPGHGPRIFEPRAKIQEYIDHRRERERQVIDAIEAGARTVETMVERIYVDTPRYLYAAAGQSVLSHLIERERERRAARETDASGEEYWALA